MNEWIQEWKNKYTQQKFTINAHRQSLAHERHIPFYFIKQMKINFPSKCARFWCVHFKWNDFTLRKSVSTQTNKTERAREREVKFCGPSCYERPICTKGNSFFVVNKCLDLPETCTLCVPCACTGWPNHKCSIKMCVRCACERVYQMPNWNCVEPFISGKCVSLSYTNYIQIKRNV